MRKYTRKRKSKKSKNGCIVTQIHIPPHDPQGNLSAEDKKNIVHLNVSHLRQKNPNAHIILVGHGESPNQETVKIVDDFIWEDLHEIDGGGTVIGMPAQYKSVYKGIKKAKELGFSRCLKTRGDSLIGRDNIIEYCEEILNSEQKMILLTQQTGYTLYKFGDCFMYGDIDLLMSIWNEENEPFHADGLKHTGASFVKHFSKKYPPQEYSDAHILHDSKNWPQMLKQYCSFRDIPELLFCDLRWNYGHLKKDPDLAENLSNGNFQYDDIFWGKINGWHQFLDGKLVSNARICEWAYTQKLFYGEK
jgi:hypothetical protein